MLGGRLGHRRTAVLDGVSILGSHLFLTGGRHLLIVRRLLVVGVSILLAHRHWWLRLVLARVAAVLRVLWMLRML